jgi:hypothetical protein
VAAAEAVQFGAVQFGVVPRIGEVSRIAEGRSFEGEWLQVVLPLPALIMAVAIMAVATVIQTINIAVEAATMVAEGTVAALW